jgi:hypothetical protein
MRCSSARIEFGELLGPLVARRPRKPGQRGVGGDLERLGRARVLGGLVLDGGERAPGRVARPRPARA